MFQDEDSSDDENLAYPNPTDIVPLLSLSFETQRAATTKTEMPNTSRNFDGAMD